QIDSLLPPQLLGVAFALRLHEQGGKEGALGMVFMSEGGTEEGKDAVAGGLYDEALIAMHRVHHQLQGRIDEAPGRFGVEVFNEGGGVLDIGKEGSDGFPFALRGAPGFQNGLLGTNARGEMRGRVAHWELGLRLWRAGRGGSGFTVSDRDYDFSIFVDSDPLILDKFLLEVF